MDPRTAVALSPLMNLTSGDPRVRVAVVDGPVNLEHPDLATARIEQFGPDARCAITGSASCRHGTAVAGLLMARREGVSPGICPGSSLLVRPVFAESWSDAPPAAPPAELAAAIVDVVQAGVQVLNLSLAVVRSAPAEVRALSDALDLAGSRNVVIVAAAGNQGTVGGSLLTRHPRVIPVAACGIRGAPIDSTNLGASIARRGLLVPGEDVIGLSPGGGTARVSGTSIAAAVVSGAAALLMSLHPGATATMLATALTGGAARRPSSVVPPLFNAWRAHQYLLMTQRTGGAA
jgi:subtilisin family serine protease